MAARIAILSSCQHESLAIALRAILPDADITSFDLNAVAGNDGARGQLAASLAGNDHVISHDIAPDYGPLSTRALSTSVRRFYLMPAFRFGGFHPDCVAVRLDQAPLGGPAGGLHSRIVVTGVLAGLAAEDILGLFNPLVFARLGYFDSLGEHCALLVEKFAAYGIDLSQPLSAWLQDGCFMLSPHHPKITVFLDLARIACAKMGMAPQASPPPTALRDPLAAFSTMPFLPDIAARCGMQPEGVFRDSLPALPLSLTEYVHASTRALARVPLSCLRASQGVGRALAALNLGIAKRPHRSAAAGAGARCLLSWHGTIVRIEAASSLIIHEALWPQDENASDLVLDAQPGADGTLRADILGGLEIAPASLPGTVTIRRQGRAMIAEAALLAVPFRGDGGGLNEAFLDISVAMAAHLRAILSADWQWQGTNRRAASARIGLRAGFILDFAIFAINLRDVFPRPVPADDENGAGYVFDLPDGPITIRPAGAPAHGPEIALLADPQRRTPNEAGSIPEFRTSLHTSWSLAPSDEILHPPLTAADRDAAWVFERCIWPGGLPTGLRRVPAALRRMPGAAVLLSPGVEGLLFNAGGALGACAPPVLGRGQSLPPGLRLEEGALLIEAAAMASAPVIDAPVVVCLGPAWRSRDGWMDAVLRLHGLAPFLPPAARLLVPPGFAEAASGCLGVLAALGLDRFAVLEAPGPICRLVDSIWLDAGEMQAGLVRGFRARIAALFPVPEGPPTRLYIKRSGARRIAQNDAFDGFLAAQGFTIVEGEALSPAARIALFRGAEMVIGAHGEDLADIVFCQDGTRVLEISPRGQFRPGYWMLAEKCGLIYGVLPCPTEGGGFDSTIQLDIGRLRGLFRVLRLCADK